MRSRDGLVLEAEHDMDHEIPGQPRADVALRIEAFSGPAAVTHERSRDEDDGSERGRRCSVDERMDEDRPAHRVTDHDGTVIQIRDLAEDGLTPRRVCRVAFVREPWIADLVRVP